MISETSSRSFSDSIIHHSEPDISDDHSIQFRFFPILIIHFHLNHMHPDIVCLSSIRSYTIGLQSVRHFDQNLTSVFLQLNQEKLKKGTSSNGSKSVIKLTS